MLAELVIIRGNSGSGKTTVAKALQHRLGHHVLLLSQDMVRREILRVKDGPDCLALPLMQQLLFYGYQHCAFTIVEGIFRSAWYVPFFRSAQAWFQDQIFAYYYDLPFAETLRRRQTKPNRDAFGAEDMQRWWVPHDYLPNIRETIFTAQVSADQAVEQILHDLSAPSAGACCRPASP